MTFSTWRRRNLIAGLLLATGALVFPSPATAYLRGVTEHPGPTSNPVIGISINRVGCNFPARPLGGSARISAWSAPGGPVLGQAAMDLGGLGRFVADGRETDDFTGQWQTQAWSRCTTHTPFGSAADAPSYVKAVEVVSASSASNSLETNLATAQCPAGKRAITGGASVGPDSGFIVDLALTLSSGAGVGSTWQAGAREVDPTSVAWRVRAFAICANIDTATQSANYAGDLRVAETTSLPASASNVLRSVSCPAGTSIVGGGARAITVDGLPANAQVALVTSQPTGNSAGWTAHAQETDPTASTWRLVVQAICANTNVAPPR